MTESCTHHPGVKFFEKDLVLFGGVGFHGNILGLLLTLLDPGENSGTLAQFPAFLCLCPVTSHQPTTLFILYSTFVLLSSHTDSVTLLL